MKNVDWRNAEEAKEYKKLGPGGYVCKIIKVEDVPEKEYLLFKYDIALGEFEGYYRDLYDHFGNWSGTFIKSYKEKALPFFKGCMTAIERSNPGYTFNNDETTLKGKLVGLVLGQEEYMKLNGDLGIRLCVSSVRDIDAIKSGDFEVPKLKKLSAAVEMTFTETNDTDDDLPF